MFPFGFPWGPRICPILLQGIPTEGFGPPNRWVAVGFAQLRRFNYILAHEEDLDANEREKHEPEQTREQAMCPGPLEHPAAGGCHLVPNQKQKGVPHNSNMSC